MNKPQSKNAQQRPRTTEGRSGSEGQAKQGGGMRRSKNPSGQGRHGNPSQPRDAEGRFEKKP